MSKADMKFLVFVDDRPCSPYRPCSLNYALFKRKDVVPILLRVKNEIFSSEYLELTKDLLKFYVDPTANIQYEAKSFLEWCNENSIVLHSFCCMSEPRQEYWQAFATQVGLTALEPDVIRALRHKPTMKKWIQACGLPCAFYKEIKTEADVKEFIHEHGFPVVVKPVDGWGALYTYVINRAQDINSIIFIIEHREMMIETYIPYTEYECCALIHDGRVLDVFPSLMPATPVQAANGDINANISVGNYRHLIPIYGILHGIVQKLVDGFKIRKGYLHLEFFASNDGITYYISELALRYPGCEIAKNHGLSYGFDIENITLDLYLGFSPKLEYGNIRSVGDLLLPYKSGHVKAVTSYEKLKSYPGVLEVHLPVRPGDILPDHTQSSFNCCGWVIIEGRDPFQVEKRMRNILNNFRLDMH